MASMPCADSPKKRKGASAAGVPPAAECADAADGAGGPERRLGVEVEAGLVTLHSHKKLKVEGEDEEGRENVVEEEEEQNGSVFSTTAVMVSALTGGSSPSSPRQRRSQEEEGEVIASRDTVEGDEVVVELVAVAELTRKGGSGLLVRRPELGHCLAVFWHHDRPFVLDDACPHRGAPLSEGDIEDLVLEDGPKQCTVSHVVCPLHFYKFDLSSGRCAEGDDWSDPAKVYEAWVQGEKVMARLPRLPPIVDDDGQADSADCFV